uniref:(northern house mosquito) hypothetical protein n=1 Tax=Culex pipiens TaxID=7175 RepID=A0A8D8NGM1_CULPI
MYAVGRGVGDKSCRESRRGSVCRVTWNRAFQTMGCTHTHTEEGELTLYLQQSALGPQLGQRSGVPRCGQTVWWFFLFSFSLFSPPFSHTHTRSHSPSSFSGFTCHLSRSLLSQAKAPTSSM